MIEKPAPGSVWVHKSGRLYRVLFIANDGEIPKEGYPLTVVYENVHNGIRYAGRLDDWHRRMSLASQQFTGIVMNETAEDEVLSPITSDALDKVKMTELMGNTANVLIVDEIEEAQAAGYKPVILDSHSAMVDYANQQNQKDPLRIFLEPVDHSQPFASDERTWCDDNVWGDEHGGAIEYVRADLHQANIEEYKRLSTLSAKRAGQVASLKFLLQSIVNDVRSMRAKDREGSVVSVENWLVGFSEWTSNPDDDTMAIEWPNLAISVGEAEAYLKELECPASSSS